MSSSAGDFFGDEKIAKLAIFKLSLCYLEKLKNKAFIGKVCMYKSRNKKPQKKNLKFPLLQMQMWKFREGKYKKKPYHILNIFAPFSAYPSFRHTLTLLLFLKTLKAKMEIWIYVVVELLNPETEYGLP